jgi:predicted nicotinamide N-methyase
MRPDDADAFVRSFTQETRFPFVPELRLRVASQMMPIWEATRRRDGRPEAPTPLWAFAWPGGLALARHVLDNQHLVAGQRVLDFGAGGGLVGIAAARAGAASVVACDVAPLAAAAQQANAALNDVRLSSQTHDMIGESLLGQFDVLLAGDVTYEWILSLRIEPWLRQAAADGLAVLLADAGRGHLPHIRLERLAEYDVPTSLELEVETQLRTTLWRVLGD